MTAVICATEAIVPYLKENKVVTILGITYKPDVDDVRESPIIRLIELMKGTTQYEIHIVDPMVKAYENLEVDLIKASKGSDLLLLGVNHSAFSHYDFSAAYQGMRTKNILDTRNFLDEKKLKQMGFHYYGL